MDIVTSTGPLEELEVDALVIVGLEGGPPELVPEPVKGERVKELYHSGEFAGKPHDIAVLHGLPGLKAKRLVIAGGGDRNKFSPAELRNAAGAAVRALKCKGVKTMALALADSGDDFIVAAVEGAILGDFEPDRYKTDPKKNNQHVNSFTVVGASKAVLDRGRILGEAQNFSRALGNEPANLLTPTRLAERAREMAGQRGLECDILDRDRMRELGMGALLGVAQGSAEPPALIVLSYKPADGAPSNSHLGLVGKGVTFDTGGISIKPAEGMEKMKYDMSGAAAVLGAMQAIAQLKPAIPVTALVPTVENMPGSRAQRPGDIVTSLAGKTIEVLNTDAEGRLILADALAYAQRLGCTHLVDAATLTGSIVVALGQLRSGAFTNNEGFLHKLLDAAHSEGEKMWHMPLDEEYKEGLKSEYADLQNIGSRWGGSITAAMFLREFAGETPWVHLDIAGTAYLDDAKPYLSKGPTGVGMRTFVKLAMSW
ncbi:MAG: leucyl aminopeptidase [Bryobacteraceae bacterium]